MLAGPFCRQVGKASHSRAIGEPTLNSRSDEVRRMTLVKDATVAFHEGMLAAAANAPMFALPS
jgi:hypothetical protein